MPFSFTPEQTALRSAIRDFADSVATLPATRAVLESDLGYDAAVWRRLATELGVTALGVPEEYGGAGAGVVELAIAAEELGRVLYSGPWVSTVLAMSAIASDPSAAQDLLPGLVDGGAATVAVAEASGSWDVADVECAASAGADGWTITGAKHYVAHAAGADLFVVVARSADGLGLYAVPTDAAGVTVTPVTAFDLTRRLSRVDLDGVSATPIGAPGNEQAVTDLLRLAALLSAAESVGGAQAALDLAVDYAKYRVQFGRVIGSFQSIKHMCADALLDVESARSAAYYAAWAADDTPGELPAVVPLAKAFCSDVFFNTAKDSHQIHGGISFTWEHDCHLYYRRAKSSRQLWGDPSAHRELLASAIGL